MSDFAAAHHVSIHQYADNTQMYMAFQPQCLDSLSQLITCTDDVTRFFIENGLQLNPSKTEVVVFGTASRLSSVDIFGGVKVAGTSLQFLPERDYVTFGSLLSQFRLSVCLSSVCNVGAPYLGG